MSGLLLSSKAKLRAALSQIPIIDEHVRRYLAAVGSTHRFVIEPDPLSGRAVAFISMPPTDEGLSIAIGTFAYQLRSALDLAACELARLSGAADTKGVYFPVAKTGEFYFEKRSRDKVSKLKPEYVALIDALAPYGPESVIVQLNALANADKHEDLLRAEPSVRGGAIRVNGRPVALTGAPRRLPDGRHELCSFAETKAQVHFKLSCSLVFGDVEGMTGKKVTEVITLVGNGVAGALAAIERGVTA